MNVRHASRLKEVVVYHNQERDVDEESCADFRHGRHDRTCACISRYFRGLPSSSAIHVCCEIL